MQRSGLCSPGGEKNTKQSIWLCGKANSADGLPVADPDYGSSNPCGPSACEDLDADPKDVKDVKHLIGFCALEVRSY